MSRKALATLAGSCIFTATIISYVHYEQNVLDKSVKNTFQVALDEQKKKEQQREENLKHMVEGQKLNQFMSKIEEEEDRHAATTAADVATATSTSSKVAV